MFGVSRLVPTYPSAPSFNPCCSGFGVRRQRKIEREVCGYLFQSLLFWIRCSEVVGPADLEQRPGLVSILVVLDSVFGAETRRRPVHPRHVSILVVLDSVFGVADVASARPATSGFNPCCSGFGVRSQPGLNDYTTITMFQSLLFWIRCSEAGYRMAANRHYAAAVSILVVLDSVFGERFRSS